jgi:hypothetical protein
LQHAFKRWPVAILRYNTRKYSIVADWINGTSFVDVAMIRYAEILLTYAEATFELSGSISDADLDKSINLLRIVFQRPI